MKEKIAICEPYYCHARREWQRQPDTGDSQVFEGTINNADVWR
jgi:hypothetical protein